MKNFLLLFLISKSNAFGLHELPWEDYVIIPLAALSLSAFAGIMSGLTVGLMSIDELELKMKLSTGSDLEKLYASKILPVLSDHHLLLVTLLLANALALETLPLVLDQMLDDAFAVILSVILTLFIAEVIPQAICIGPNRVPIASTFSKLVSLVIIILYPVAYPIARLLDWTIGHQEQKQFNNEELKTLFTLQLNNIGYSEVLKETQVSIIHHAIDTKNKTIRELFIPIYNVFSLNTDFKLTEEGLSQILEREVSRVPVKDLSGS